MRRSTSVFSLCLLLFGFCFVSSAHASGSGPEPSDGDWALQTVAILGGSVTLIYNTVSVIRSKPSPLAWTLAGYGFALLNLVNAANMNSYGYMGFVAGLPSLLVLAPGNLIMGICSSPPSKKKTKVSFGSMPMIDARGAIVPGVGLQFARF